MKNFLFLSLIFFVSANICFAGPNYTYEPADNTTNGVPHMTNDERMERNYTGSYYDEYGALHYDGSKAAARKKQIVEDYWKSHDMGMQTVTLPNGYSYQAYCYDGLDESAIEINTQYMNSAEYKALPKEPD